MTSHSLSQPGRALAGAVASGVATALLPPARIPVRLRRSMHVGFGLAAAGGMAWMLGRPETPDTPPVDAEDALDAPATDPAPPKLPLPARLTVASLFGLLVGASSAAGMALDTAAEDALVRRGVRRPRWWIGAAATVLTAAMSWADARFEDEAGPSSPTGVPPVD